MNRDSCRTQTTLLFLCLGLVASTSYGQSVLFVDQDAEGPAHDGVTWCTALANLSDALDVAGAGTTIRVADGRYTPDSSGLSEPRDATFQLLNGVTIEGGYAGCGAADPDERDFILFETILSGDLNDDDVISDSQSDCCSPHASPACEDTACGTTVCSYFPTCCTEEWDLNCVGIAGLICDLCDPTGNVSDNSYHVITGSGTDRSAVVGGFTVSGGRADLTGGLDGGGGMLNEGGSPTVANCRFTGNFARVYGAGMFNLAGSSPLVLDCAFKDNWGGNGAGVGMANRNESHPMVIDCRFEGNSSTGFGIAGGMLNFMYCSPTLVGCRFSKNVGTWGGAIHNEGFSDLTALNCSFVGNSSGRVGGAVWTRSGTALMVNCVFSGNTASEEGGAVYADTVGSELTLINCTLTENTAPIGGGVIAKSGAEAILTNTILWNNHDEFGTGESAQLAVVDAPPPTVNYSTIQGLTGSFGGVGNIGDDPLFVNPAGPDGIIGTADDDLYLLAGSPCIDAADNTAVPEDVEDLDGDGNTTEPTPIDLVGNPRFYDDADTADTGVGPAPVVDMGAIEYLVDCNRNRVPDDEDIAGGHSEDDDSSGVPDECERAPLIVESDPPDGAIDARQPYDLNGEAIDGWWIVRLNLDGVTWDLAAEDFDITEQGGDGVAPTIIGFGLDGSDVIIVLNSPIEPGAWTTITHVGGGSAVRLGYLPGDVNGDGMTSPLDILMLVDVLNGVREAPGYAADIDRDGMIDVGDIVREIDLLNGAGAFEPWNGRSLPE